MFNSFACVYISSHMEVDDISKTYYSNNYNPHNFECKAFHTDKAVQIGGSHRLSKYKRTYIYIYIYISMCEQYCTCFGLCSSPWYPSGDSELCRACDSPMSHWAATLFSLARWSLEPTASWSAEACLWSHAYSPTAYIPLTPTTASCVWAAGRKIMEWFEKVKTIGFMACTRNS